MTAITDSWQHEYITTNGVKLHYVTQGNGALMLMLHGFPEFWYSWRHQIPAFATDYQVVALDLRGYNDSDKPKAQSAYVMDEFIKDIEGVITGLGYDKCVLVGHDWGGAIAWHFAYSRPQMVEKLIVLNMPHPARMAEGLRTPQQLLRSWYMFFFQLPEIPEALIQASDYQLIETAFTAELVNKNALTKTDIEAYKDAVSKRGALTAMLNYYRNIPRQRMLSTDWSILEVPTLMIWGESDVALGKELTYSTQAYVRNLQIKYIANVGHLVQQEQPQLVNQYMQEFLETV
ncbi:alpha/beta fold hydrolase [Chlorogloea sp. CCALA 695]|uniref:alpha/beta fold hydrolase n=1 Tax=Chlorogloea sp. CCALA 695 TaxID=2107693 RepID=UPI000D06D1D6|nr:alpha/beta hydrolase [Chlorogloea sp. CCALA 695]PSB31465.1 epoxide hydrolase [Chlorogloea sp. CCALA 695]